VGRYRLVDGCFERTELLKARGWYSFEPYWKFGQSLCSPDDWQIYKQYVVETRKEALGNYRSDFVTALRGGAHEADDAKLTACDWNYVAVRDSAAHRSAWEPFEQEQMRLRQREVAGVSSSRSRYSAVFRHALTPRWNLALGVDARGLGIETADTVAKPPRMGPLPIGWHLTWMALVPKGKSGISFNDPELIFVPQYFVPFDRAYGIFWDMEGLEINVRA
jgi:hypothetical protein